MAFLWKQLSQNVDKVLQRLNFAKMYWFLGFLIIIFNLAGESNCYGLNDQPSPLQLVNLRGRKVNEDINPHKHTQVVDPQGKYVLEWFVDWNSKEVYFNVTVETRGWVALGLNKREFMNGADIVVGGVGSDGKPYFSDRHGVGNIRPVQDESQDWNFLHAWESGTHTFLSFSRPFETCDTKQDVAITEDRLTIIWAWGETDDENEFHTDFRRGSMDAYILDPDISPKIISELDNFKNISKPQYFNSLGDWKVWRIRIQDVMPKQDTTYSCTMHKAPTRTKHHIVGFRPVLTTEADVRHIHHLLFFKCFTPKSGNADQIFGRFVGMPGEECYRLSEPYSMPTHYCREIAYVWGRNIAGGSAFFPDHVGQPITSETPDEYYIFQLHYDNPDLLSNVQLDFSLEMFYTDKLRPNDAGLFYAGSPLDHHSIVIPPHSLDHFIYGFCSTQCTKKIFPKGGVTAFATKSHTHLAGTKNRLLVIRDSPDRTEIPIYIDDNYNFDYQPYRPLREEINIYPGDIIYHRCNYQTTNRSTATVGGFSTRDEMCHGWFWYFPYIPYYNFCQSEIRSDAYRQFLQIDTVAFSNQRRKQIVVTPSTNRGLSTDDAATRINWSVDNRRQLQTHQRFLPQVSICESHDPESSDQLLAQNRQTMLSSPFQSPFSSPIDPKLLPKLEPDHSYTTFTELNKEIHRPKDEYLHLWPSDVKWYSRPSMCPKE